MININNQLLNECAGDPIPQHLADLIAERDCLRNDLMRALGRSIRVESENAELRNQVEDLRAEALAWHAQAEDSRACPNCVTITCSLETMRKLWAMLRPCNPYANEEP